MKNNRRSCSISSSNSDKSQNEGINKRRRSSSKETNRPEYGSTNSKDPKMVASRIFVGNLPTSSGVKREDVTEIFKKYGKITGLLLMSGYAFVQFDNENSAVSAKQENGKLIKGHFIEVRVANEKKKIKNHNPTQLPNGLAFHFQDPAIHPQLPIIYPQIPTIPSQIPTIHSQTPTIHSQIPTIHSQVPTIHQDGSTKLLPNGCGVLPPYIYQCTRPLAVPVSPAELFGSHQVVNKALVVPLDCEIILVDEEQRTYGELVMNRLMAVGLLVEIKALPFDSNTLTMVESALRRGSLFAIIVNSQNELHRSITVNILYGSPQEHRNMPLEDAISLITRKFDKYVITKKESLASSTSSTNHSNNSSGKDFTPPSMGVIYLLNLIADGRFLTLRELDVVLEYVNERKEEILMNDGQSASGCSTLLLKDIRCSQNSEGDHIVSKSQDYLNQPISNHLEGNAQRSLSSVFDNPLVQKALDSLIMKGPNILKSVISTRPQSPDTSAAIQHHDNLFPSANHISNYPSFNQTIGRLHQIPCSERYCNNDSENVGWLAYLGN